MTFASCTKPDIIETAQKESEEIINSFVFEDGIREYAIDGKTVTDHPQIANAAKNAFNVHYDYPNERVVISTTPKMFESYQNSNTELKHALEQSDKAVATDNNNEDNRSARVTAAPPSYIPGFANKSVIGMRWKNTLNGITTEFFSVSSDADLTTLAVRINVTNGSGTILDEGKSGTVNFNDITKTSTTYVTVFKCYMNNESSTNSLTRTFYTGKNYTGSSKTFTAPKNGNADLSSLRSSTGYQSYK